ncbi:hypothetical protein BDN70DRAFT_934929 [Pholiota conissans]|uniref:Uncharacterized protein n=1 Tax=Pholiota conissans TaxID=109636 RepID=A0A9P5YXR4_9AGAR|nr:hypothetical protein BDN70DRAFT_934929 [Pholiota conissans]
MANLFSNANGIVINGGTFSAIQGHAYIGGSTAGRQDECQDENIQEEILTVLSNAIIKSPLPLLLLVASRPEFAIRESFSLPEISRITQNLGLYEDYEAEKDVETFLRSSFSKIKARHPAVRHLVDWPPESSIKYFIDMSSRQFIYAATVVKYVQSPRHNPALRMNILRGLSKIPSNDMPFSQLDLLYTFILDSIDNWPRVSEILALLILDKHHTMTSDFVDIIFGYETGDIYVALTDMHALVHLPEQDSQDEYLHLHHASMRDFLIDPLRSGRFHINPPKGYAHLSKCCIRSMMRLFGQGKPSESLYAIMTEFIQFFPKSFLTPELFNALESFILPAASILPIYALP